MGLLVAGKDNFADMSELAGLLAPGWIGNACIRVDTAIIEDNLGGNLGGFLPLVWSGAWTPGSMKGHNLEIF